MLSGSLFRRLLCWPLPASCLPRHLYFLVHRARNDNRASLLGPQRGPWQSPEIPSLLLGTPAADCFAGRSRLPASRLVLQGRFAALSMHIALAMTIIHSRTRSAPTALFAT